MNPLIINTPCYFDGHIYHDSGPYRLLIKDGVICSIQKGGASPVDLPDGIEQADIRNVGFLMPGLVEAHCHLFLDGGELDFKARSEYLKLPLESMLQTARDNVKSNLASGVTLIRDAGDRYGVNHAVREEFAARGEGPLIRSPGLGLRRPKKYGAFMAQEVSSAEEIRAAITARAKSADDLKILLTGIIDFEAGAVTKPPQFDLESLNLIVAVAAEHGLKTFAHCSGLDGLELAVQAGVDSIEHGFFMEEGILDVMAEKGIAWVPTFSPVHFQWERPELAGWNENTIANLRRILDDHLHYVEMAYHKGVQLVAGSDAGSHGVRHGRALIDELDFFLEAGLPMQEVLKSVTSRPRKLWGSAPANIVENSSADFVVLGSSPFERADALRDVQMVFSQGSLTNYQQRQKVSA